MGACLPACLPCSAPQPCYEIRRPMRTRRRKIGRLQFLITQVTVTLAPSLVYPFSSTRVTHDARLASMNLRRRPMWVSKRKSSAEAFIKHRTDSEAATG
ncbi:hypothetical protein FA13DRAFT_1736933 [Coprinellus micaceus]|uniref:Uncharacterized protein n=1 Tax=Coprinellus micaceus TaxID=71717 RepID=A0A4Y7SZ33_COPMI|nr:hypothetical protein FA13DRAFT_1736933 [Coprinellus micaceus]